MILSTQFVGPQVNNGRYHRLQDGELCTQAEREQHNEEQNGPQRSNRQLGDCFRVHDERQPRS